MKKTSLENIRQILVINLGGIGDLLLSSPALRALKKAHPQAQLTVMAVTRAVPYVRSLPFVDVVESFHYGEKYLIENLATLLKLRLRRYDLALNMRTMESERGAARMELLMELIHPRLKVGRNTAGRGSFFDLSIPESAMGDKFEMEYDIDTVRVLGVDVDDRRIELSCHEEAQKKIERILLANAVVPNVFLVGIHPGGRPSRRWAAANFITVINELNRLMPSTFVVTGNRQEQLLAEQIRKGVSARLIDCAGQTSFHELVCLIKRCNLFISDDTGPMHIAAALKVPLVAIFGPGHIERFNPRFISERVIPLHKKCSCSPCNKFVCDDMRCLEAITPDEVIEAAFRLLEEMKME